MLTHSLEGMSPVCPSIASSLPAVARDSLPAVASRALRHSHRHPSSPFICFGRNRAAVHLGPARTTRHIANPCIITALHILSYNTSLSLSPSYLGSARMLTSCS